MSAIGDHRHRHHRRWCCWQRSLFVTTSAAATPARRRASLSRETRGRDRSTRPPRRAEPLTGRAVRAGRAWRPPSRPASSCPSAAPLPAPYVPPDPERSASPAASSSTAARRPHGPQPRRLRRRRASPSCGRSSAVASARRSPSARSTTSWPASGPTTTSSTWPRAGPGHRVPGRGIPKADDGLPADVARPAWRPGIVALYQKCPHLGCRVPNCTTSQWFECPCHGSQYNRVGEKKGGPAPRGMDRFPRHRGRRQLVVDTGTIVHGPPIGTNTTGQEAEGPALHRPVVGH